MAVIGSAPVFDGTSHIDYHQKEFQQYSQDIADKNFEMGRDNAANTTNANCVTGLKKNCTAFNPNS